MSNITLTETALAHVKNMLQTHAETAGIRISIKMTGCSGFSYQVDIEAAPKADDYVFTQADGSRVFVDPKSYPLMEGLLVDYVRTGLNSAFKFINPQATSLCGCGESFTVEDK